MTLFADLGDNPENTRVRKIGQAAMRLELGHTVAFCTEDKPKVKVERYKSKLLKMFPGLKIIDQFDGPVAGVVSVRVARKEGYWAKNPCEKHAGKFGLDCPACNAKNAEYVVTEK